MKSAFVAPEVLAEYLSLPVELLDEFVMKNIISDDCYFQIGDIKRYSIEKVEKALIEYTKKNNNPNSEIIQTEQYQNDYCLSKCDKYKKVIRVLEEILCSVSRSRDDILQLSRSILEPVWDFDFNTSFISAWKREAKSLLDLCENNNELTRNILIIIQEMEEFDENSEYNKIVK